jgi:hemerythrin
MKELDWDSSLDVGVDEVDDDHRRMVKLFNLLAHAVSDGEDPDYQEALLDELIAFTVWHFRHEERLMLKYAYTDADAHKQQHRELIDGVTEIQEKFLEADRQLLQEDVEYLERWVTAHIIHTDKKMGAYLATAM